MWQIVYFLGTVLVMRNLSEFNKRTDTEFTEKPIPQKVSFFFF